MFERNDMIDCFLVSINSEEFLLNSRKQYEMELERNALFHEMLEKDSSKKNVNKKMDSDRKLVAYKKNVELSTLMNKKHEKIYIAGALVIKYKNRIQILISGYDTHYKNYDPNYYLHYAILEHYKNDYDYADLNGMTGDFTKENPYYGLNEFKLNFRPKVYEYIGEYDLVIRPLKYRKLRSSGKLAKVFNKPDNKRLDRKVSHD